MGSNSSWCIFLFILFSVSSDWAIFTRFPPVATKKTIFQTRSGLQFNGENENLLEQKPLKQLSLRLQSQSISILGSLPTSQQIKLSSSLASSSLGQSLHTGEGDLNKDGFNDIAIGLPYYSSFAGRVDIIYGSSTLNSLVIGNSLTTTVGMIINGAAANDQTGFSISLGGDVNSDGFSDLLISAHGYSSYTGKVYLIYGSNNFPATLSLSALTTPSQGIIITGATSHDCFGYSVSLGGDVNGDTIPDLIIGAYGYSGGGNTGRVYLIYGGNNLGNLAVNVMTSLQGTTITGVTSNYNTGYSVSVAMLNLIKVYLIKMLLHKGYMFDL